MTALEEAIKANRHDVIEFLMIKQFNIDVDVETNNGQTSLFTAVSMDNLAAVKLLLERGACVNHRDWRGRTPLYDAVRMGRPVLVDLLISRGADVNIVAYMEVRKDRCFKLCHEFSPLKVALHSYENFLYVMQSDHTNPAARNARMSAHLDVIKLLVPHCNTYDVTAWQYDGAGEFVGQRTLPGAQLCFMIESKQCDLRVTKHLLRNGATTKFDVFYATVKHSNVCRADLVTSSFVKLCLLSGCTFSEYFVRIKHEQEQGPAGQDHRAKHVHALVKNVFSQPLTLQEMSIMAIRKSIGSRQLWAKIDALPVGIPAHVKDIIHLKLY